jgi:hypothetical protein
LLRFEYNLSRMLLVVRCPLLAALEMRQCRAFPVASRMCSRPLACRLLSVARSCCTLPVTLCRVFAVFCAVSAVSRMPHVALACCLLSVARCRLSFPRCLWSVACCTAPLHVALHVALHLVVVRCMLLEVWRMLPVARCMSFAVRGILPAAWRMSSGCRLSHTTCRRLHFPRCLMRVVRCIFPNAC